MKNVYRATRPTWSQMDKSETWVILVASILVAFLGVVGELVVHDYLEARFGLQGAGLLAAHGAWAIVEIILVTAGCVALIQYYKRLGTEEEEEGEELTKEVAAMDAFLACPAFQFRGYYKYLNDDSPFSTQQGIKGAEFERVLVVLDDDEGTHVQFSYDKYLGIRQLSDRDEANKREGKETTVDRTRRLFYVCCTRAMKDLAVVLFTSDVVIAQSRISSLGLFPAHAIHLEDEIGAD